LWSKLPHAAIVAAPQTASHTLLQAVEKLGILLAENLLDAGAADILTVAKRQTADEIMRQKAAKHNAASADASSSISS